MPKRRQVPIYRSLQPRYLLPSKKHFLPFLQGCGICLSIWSFSKSTTGTQYMKFQRGNSSQHSKGWLFSSESLLSIVSSAVPVSKRRARNVHTYHTNLECCVHPPRTTMNYVRTSRFYVKSLTTSRLPFPEHSSRVWSSSGPLPPPPACSGRAAHAFPDGQTSVSRRPGYIREK